MKSSEAIGLGMCYIILYRWYRSVITISYLFYNIFAAQKIIACLIFLLQQSLILLLLFTG